jgi:hypothetical protein
MKLVFVLAVAAVLDAPVVDAVLDTEDAHAVSPVTPAATAAAAAIRRNGSPVEGRVELAASSQNGHRVSVALMCREQTPQITNRSAMVS